MSEINPHTTIRKDLSSEDDLDFDFLRRDGIRYIEKFGSKIWTDYNTHDPGITILEVLSYAITDLGHRINLPIEDLMTRKEGDGFQDQFFKAAQILPSSATNALDFRKLIIDLPEIKNCWIKKVEIEVHADLKHRKLSYQKEDFVDTLESSKSKFNLKGLYKILVETADETTDLPKSLENAIFKTFHAHRNLCEDLVGIEKVETHPISVCANIEVSEEADEELVHARILVALEDYLSPAPVFHSLEEMVTKGLPMEEIFEGPLLHHGFIDLEELRMSELRKEVRLSDIINILMGIEGVKLVKEITMGNCEEHGGTHEEIWVICIPEGKKPILCDKTVMNYFKGVLPINLNRKRAKSYKDEILFERRNDELNAGVNRFPSIPQGRVGDWGEYDSIQHDFPETYGLSDKGLSTQLGVERAVKAKQLKGYLLFFDQVLASYFKQLDKVKDLLALDQKHTKTYFTQAVTGIREMEDLVKDLPENEAAFSEKLMDFLDDSVTRRNQILDHLIARFAERFGNYAFLMKMLYGTHTDEIVLQNKIDFLKEYDVISRTRGDAFDYFEKDKSELWDTNNVSGTQKRIARLAGMKDYSRRNLSESPVEIYRYENVGGNWVYRWRIRDQDKRVVLSATVSYPSYNAAGNEMYFALLKILETGESDIKVYLDRSFGQELTVGSFHVHQTASSGKYSFDVINPEIPSEDDTDFIIAKQYRYYATRNEVIHAILELIRYIKFKFTEEGIFLVEHILLRPNQKDIEHKISQEAAGKPYVAGDFLPFCSDDYEQCQYIDPYSFRVSIVLPGYTYRFGNKDFRDYLEKLIREELPSHILAKICWVGYREGEEPEIPQHDIEHPEDPVFKENQLVRFEKAYKAFLYELTQIHKKEHLADSMNNYNEILNDLIKAINELHTIYPTGRLYDCEEEEEDLDGKLILGKTNLGTL